MASEYSYTFEQIRRLTLREIHIALLNINVRKQNHYSMLAALQGVKLKTGTQPGVKKQAPVEFTPKHDSTAEFGIHSAMARKRDEYSKRGE